MLSGKTVVLGVTGGIACYKACEILSRLKKLGAEVFVVMTKNAAELVTPLTFETLSQNPVAIETFDKTRAYEIGHISLAKRADVFVVAPATANVIGKLAHGVADDLLTTTALACKTKKIICPAMNTDMYENAATEDNLKTLAARGWQTVEPVTGRLACGDTGSGKLADPEIIVKKIIGALMPEQDLAGKTVLVTAGATRESLDGVRFISNESSGKMGVALAERAAARGARVLLVHGHISVSVPQYFDSVKAVSTTNEMQGAVIGFFKTADAFIMAGAPADFRPVSRAENKIKAKSFTLELEKTPDISAEIGKIKGDKKLIIFAAETENGEHNALLKLNSKNADLVVLNNVNQAGAGFNSDTNIVTVLDGRTAERFPKLSKSDVADLILDRLAVLWSQK